MRLSRLQLMALPPRQGQKIPSLKQGGWKPLLRFFVQGVTGLVVLLSSIVVVQEIRHNKQLGFANQLEQTNRQLSSWSEKGSKYEESDIVQPKHFGVARGPRPQEESE